VTSFITLGAKREHLRPTATVPTASRSGANDGGVATTRGDKRERHVYDRNHFFRGAFFSALIGSRQQRQTLDETLTDGGTLPRN
jgi:hypothetical protein